MSEMRQPHARVRVRSQLLHKLVEGFAVRHSHRLNTCCNPDQK